MKKLISALALTAMLGACASPGVYTEQGASEDGRLLAYQITAVPVDGKVQNALLIQDNATGAWELKMASETLPLGRQLVENLLSPGVLPALITGAAGIRIADEGSCGDGVCGTIVYTTALSGSQSGAIAHGNANATVDTGKGYY
jgi:hypothetical protein